MSLPNLIDIDVQQRMADLNVPVLRQPKFMALLKSFLSSTSRLKDNISNDQLGHTNYSTWNSVTAYIIGDRVNGISLDTNTYECINPCTNIPTTDTNYWYVVSADNIGLSEKLNYNCQKMQLEYILNKRFNNVSSILPPYNQTVGNIYITTNQSFPRILWSAKGSNTGGFTTPKTATKHWYCPENTGLSASLNNVNYIFWVPSTIPTNLTLTSSDVINLIKQEIKKYNSVGIIFDGQMYT